MSYILKRNNVQLAISFSWNTIFFSRLTNTSFPKEVTKDFVWEHDDYWLGWVDDPEPIPPSPEELMQQYEAEFTSAIQSHLDSVAQAKGYDNIVSACSYAGAPNPFQQEAIAFVAWRGAVWDYCYKELAKVTSGARAIPTIAELLGELPPVPNGD